MTERKPRKKPAGASPPAVPDDNPLLQLLKALEAAKHAHEQRQEQAEKKDSHVESVDATTFCAAVTATLRRGEGCPCEDNFAKIDRIHVNCEQPNCRIDLVKALARIQCAEQIAVAVAASSERPSDEILAHLTKHVQEAGRLYGGYWQSVSKIETGGKVH